MHFGKLFCILLLSRVVLAECPVERVPVKTATDPQSSQVGLSPLPATIESLHAIPAPPRPLPHQARISPVETTIYSVVATLVAYRLTPQGEIHLVLSDEQRRTIVAIIPSPGCASGSRLLPQIASVRATFDRRYLAKDVFTEARRAVEVQGVGFFDFFRGQQGLGPNGLSLHPVTAIDFSPSVPSKAPPQVGRRRAVGSGGARGCARPTLALATSRGSACAGEPVTISWQASDPAARVTIDGVGISLPPSGSRIVTMSGSAVHSGHAINSCGRSDEALAVVTLAPSATASLSGPSSVTSGASTTLSVALNGVASWTLTSFLGNAITPSSGTSSRTVTYAASRTGTDTITLATAGGACGNPTRVLSIAVNSPPDTNPPNSGLRCCDGTRSPTCFSCANKRGCCSSHGGVCGCP